MLVVFVGNPCLRIYIPSNLYKIDCLIFIKIILIIQPTKLRPDELGKFWPPTYNDPPRIKLIQQYHIQFLIHLNVTYLHVHAHVRVFDFMLRSPKRSYLKTYSF